MAVRETWGHPAWAAISAANLEKLEIPPHVEKLHIWADLDRSGTGERAADALAYRLHVQGVTIYIHMPPDPNPLHFGQ